MFINVMDADLKPHTGSHAEYHRLYADLQIDLTGGEGWGYETAPGTEVEPYQPDIGKRTARMPFSALWARGGSPSSSPVSCTAPAWKCPAAIVSASCCQDQMEDKYHG